MVGRSLSGEREAHWEAVGERRWGAGGGRGTGGHKQRAALEQQRACLHVSLPSFRCYTAAQEVHERFDALHQGSPTRGHQVVHNDHMSHCSLSVIFHLILKFSPPPPSCLL